MSSKMRVKQWPSLLWMLDKYQHRYKMCEVGFFYYFRVKYFWFCWDSLLFHLQILFFQVILIFKCSYSLFPPTPVAFSAVVNLVLQNFIDFCPLTVCPCLWFCSAWGLCLWSWWILLEAACMELCPRQGGAVVGEGVTGAMANILHKALALILLIWNVLISPAEMWY